MRRERDGDIEWMETYETGDSGVVVSGHDWVDGWRRRRRRRKKRWKVRSAEGKGCL